jgi:hypothetical protein
MFIFLKFAREKDETKREGERERERERENERMVGQSFCSNILWSRCSLNLQSTYSEK